MELQVGTFIVRGLAFVLWLIVALRILRADRPVSRLARQAITLMVVFGMLVLWLGSWVPIGLLPGPWATTIYTSFTVFAGILALAILSTTNGGGSS